MFIASSEELRMERLEFTDMIQQLNRILRPRGVEIEPVKWEYLDASMGPAHKQEEYNNELKQCELCLVLYWTKFGEYTRNELETAYKELKAGRNPRKLYVYFKNAEEMSPDLKEFKESFATEYGHFFCRFENVDTMRLNFLLQFEDYQNKRGESLVQIRDSKVEVAGQTFADLQQVPFCRNNPEYKNLLESIEMAEEMVRMHPDDMKFRQKLHDLKEKRDQMEQGLLDTAKLITQFSTKASSARLSEAIRLFELGDNRGANAVLNMTDIERDAKANRSRIDAARELEASAREALETNIEEYRLKIKSLSVSLEKGWVDEVIDVYAKATNQARGYISDEKFAELLLNYADFLYDNNQFHLIGPLYEESLKIYRQLAEQKPNIFLSDVVRILCCKGSLHRSLRFYDEAEEEFEEALTLSRKLAETNPDFLSEVADSLHGLGVLYMDLYRFKESETAFRDSLSIRRKLANFDSEDLALSLNALGVLHWKLHCLEDAKIELTESLNIYRELAKKNPESFLPDVALTLSNIGYFNSEQGAHNEAEKELEEALSIRRELAKSNPEAFLPDLAMTLTNIGILHKESHRYKEAERETFDSLSIFRELASVNPDVFLEGVAKTLNNLGNIHMHIHCYKESEEEYIEAEGIYRELAKNNPEFFLPEVAMVLSNLGELYKAKDSLFQARDCWTEALEIYRSLLSEAVDAHDREITRLQSWLADLELASNGINDSEASR